MRNLLVVATVVLGSTLISRADDPNPVYHAPPGTYETSWVGNTFGGDGWPNGVGEWVQQSASKMDVSPDGTVLAGILWDEAGRCAGLYKDGKVNKQTLQVTGPHAQSAWGWGTGNHAVSINGTSLFIGNTGKKLLQFTWTPGDLESAKFVTATDLPEKPVALNSRGTTIAIVYADSVELRNTTDFGVIGSFKVDGATDAALAPDDSIWLVVEKAVRHYSAKGEVLGNDVPGLGAATAVSFDNQHRLMVCDNGPDQQVKFFDVSADPKLVATFGDQGGVYSGVPGLAEPKKLFALHGAGTDAAGNIYVTMSFSDSPAGNLFMRSFTPDGTLRWQMTSLAFVDTFNFDPDSDGTMVYTRNTALSLDLSKSQPGSEWSLHAITLDPIKNPTDPRPTLTGSSFLRRIQDKRVLYCVGQMSGGLLIYTFDDPTKGWIAKKVGEFAKPGTWAWDITPTGDIWNGDEGDQIKRYAFKGWKSDGSPDYDWTKAESWPRPDDFRLVTRVIYDEANDSLYVIGYLKGQPNDSWGVTGRTARRYDGWVSGKKTIAWTTTNLATTPDALGKDKPLSAKSVCLAGDYLFFTMVMPEKGIQYVHIYSAKDGSYVGTFEPGPAVGHAGWVDMPYAVQAVKRKNGEYLILDEEDWRGKNILYRWSPNPVSAAN